MDSHLYAGYEIPHTYDSLLGKLIVWGPDRDAAIARAKVALDDLVLDGVVTNREFHRALLDNDVFRDGAVTTALLDRVGAGAFLASRRA
jgi:acetyl-CoA carboxylase biotin carboxylase subunit